MADGSKDESAQDSASDADQARNNASDEVSKSVASASEGAKSDDELDPELIRLPRPKTRMRPIMAMAIIAICLALGLSLWRDFTFYFASNTPSEVAADALGEAHDNHFVTTRLTPDRPLALRVKPAGRSTGPIVMPALGSEGKLWVLLPTTGNYDGVVPDAVYSGRLRPLADLQLGEVLHKHLRKAPPMYRAVSVDAAASSVATHSESVSGPGGDTIVVKAETPIRVTEVDVSRARIEATTATGLADEAGWTLALRNAGILPADQGAVSQTTSTWTFEVPAPNGVEAVSARLRQQKIFGAAVKAIERQRDTTWGALQLEDKHLVLASESDRVERQADFRVASLSVASAPRVASGALLLDTTEKPGQFWYVPFLVGLLALFAFVFGFGLFRTLRS